MTTQTIDQAKAEAFGGQIVGTLNGGALMLMISIGHRTGLFDTMAKLPASTSAQIAQASGLNERYVREWLGAMTVGRIVHHDPIGLTYTLPAEHAASLTRAAGPGNLAIFAQLFTQLTLAEDGIVESFQKGGGVPYEGFPRFQELMSEMSTQVVDATLIDVTLPLVDGLTAQLERGIDVADVGCGAGHAINLMAQRFPNSRFTGYDFSEEGVSLGRAEAKRLGLTNATFDVKDAATLDSTTLFGLITTFDAIHDQAKPARVLEGIAQALEPDGVYLCVDIQADSTHAGNMDHPLGPYLYSISTVHCMTVSLAYGGVGLGTAWGEQVATQMMKDAGFRTVDVRTVEGDILNNYYIARK